MVRRYWIHTAQYRAVHCRSVYCVYLLGVAEEVISVQRRAVHCSAVHYTSFTHKVSVLGRAMGCCTTLLNVAEEVTLLP